MRTMTAPTTSHRSLGTRTTRFQIVDMIRGAAILGVVLFHFVWDLAFLGLTSPAIAAHPLWIAFGRGLAGTFMVLVGISLVLASRNGLNGLAFVRRLLVLGLAASAITLVTRIVFPESYVYFGILHAIFAASLLGAALLRLPIPLVLLLGLAVVAMGSLVETPAFDRRWLAWIGFASSPAQSNDFVPIFPWVGWTAFGVAAAKAGLARGWADRLPAFDGSLARAVSWCGRWSLTIYLVHQPILLAVLFPISRLF